MLFVLWIQLLREYRNVPLPWYTRCLPWLLILHHAREVKRKADEARARGEEPAPNPYLANAVHLLLM